MRELQRRQRIKRRLYSTPILLGLCLLTIALARGAIVIMQKEHKSASEVAALELKAAELSQDEGRLSGEIERLGTQEGINEEIKQKFNVSAEGEHVAIIVDRDAGSSSDATTSKPWYKRIWGGILSAI